MKIIWIPIPSQECIFYDCMNYWVYIGYGKNKSIKVVDTMAKYLGTIFDEDKIVQACLEYPISRKEFLKAAIEELVWLRSSLDKGRQRNKYGRQIRKFRNELKHTK